MKKSRFIRSFSIFDRGYYKHALLDLGFIIGMILVLLLTILLFYNQSKTMNIISTTLENLRYDANLDLNRAHGYEVAPEFLERAESTKNRLHTTLRNFILIGLLCIMLSSAVYSLTWGVSWLKIAGEKISFKNIATTFIVFLALLCVAVLVVSILLYFATKKGLDRDVAKGLSVATILSIPYLLFIFHSTSEKRILLKIKDTLEIALFRFVLLFIPLMIAWFVASIYLLVVLSLAVAVARINPLCFPIILLIGLLPALAWLRNYLLMAARDIR